KILHTDTKVDRATPQSAAPERRVQSLVRPSTPCGPFSLDASTVRSAPRRQRHRTVSGPHATPQPVSAASLGQRASAKDNSVHLAANPAPLRRIIVFRVPTQHKRLTLLRYIEDVRGVIRLETTV
ncbi:hypothetical protein TcG_11769, partial [Trypanosoma cruzi]